MKVKDIINNTLAVSADEGQKVYEVVADSISNGQAIELDFKGIEILTTAFLNAAIGQLYSRFSSEQLNKFLKIIYIEESDTKLIYKVVKRAKEYFADRNNFSQSANAAIYGA